MSTEHSPEYHDGFATGYRESEDDLIEIVNDTITEWHGLNIVSDSQMLALKDILHHLELRQARREEV